MRDRRRKTQAKNLVDMRNKERPRPNCLDMSDVSLMQYLLGAKYPMSSQGWNGISSLGFHSLRSNFFFVHKHPQGFKASRSRHFFFRWPKSSSFSLFSFLAWFKFFLTQYMHVGCSLIICLYKFKKLILSFTILKLLLIRVYLLSFDILYRHSFRILFYSILVLISCSFFKSDLSSCSLISVWNCWTLVSMTMTGLDPFSCKSNYLLAYITGVMV